MYLDKITGALEAVLFAADFTEICRKGWKALMI